MGEAISQIIAIGVSKGLDIAMNNPKIKGLLDMFGMLGNGSTILNEAGADAKSLWDNIKGIGGSIDLGLSSGIPTAMNQLKPSQQNKMPDNTKLEDNTSRTNDLIGQMLNGVPGRFV